MILQMRPHGTNSGLLPEIRHKYLHWTERTSKENVLCLCPSVLPGTDTRIVSGACVCSGLDAPGYTLPRMRLVFEKPCGHPFGRRRT